MRPRSPPFAGPPQGDPGSQGITINALPLLDERVIGTYDRRHTYTSAKWGTLSVADFYQQNVIGGAGSFMVEATDLAALGDALKRKLLLEFIARPDGTSLPASQDTRSASLAPLTR